MSKNLTLRNTCRLCGSSHLQTVMRFPATPVGDAYVASTELRQEQEMFPLSLQLCLDCGQLQLGEVVAPDVLYGRFTYRTSVSLGLVDHFNRYAEQVCRKLQPPQDALVLDIGSNDGTLLHAFRERHLRVLGVDPARVVAAEANQRGIETLPEYFDRTLAPRILRDKGAADIVVSNNTLANIDDLHAFLAAVKVVLKPDGVFVFETGYALDLARHMVFDNIYHEHLSYFLVSPLRAFFQSLGLCLFDVERVDTKGGSIRGYVCRTDSGRSVSSSVEDLCVLETQEGISRPETFLALNHQVDNARQELLRLLRQYRAEAKTIAGYGASVGVTTMLYHLELGPYIDFLVDENSLKHGLHSPGLHKPVESHRELLHRRPDVVVILAWRYAAAIMAKNADYLKGGGEFIVPLPYPVVHRS